MAIGRQTVAAKIVPHRQAITERFTAASAVLAGQVVGLTAAGLIEKADTTSASPCVVGIVIQDLPAGGTGDVVVYGKVSAVTGATPASTIHATDTAGELGESAGSNPAIIGYAFSATDVFVRPVQI